jgi:hypothetical protein
MYKNVQKYRVIRTERNLYVVTAINVQHFEGTVYIIAYLNVFSQFVEEVDNVEPTQCYFMQGSASYGKYMSFIPYESFCTSGI